MLKRLQQTAKNYAQALIELTGDNLNSQEIILEEIKTVNEFVCKLETAKKVFANPVISKDEKKKLAQKLQDKISKITLNLLYVLIDKQRFYLLPEIQDQLSNLVNKKKGIVVAEVTSAFVLDETTLENIKQKLENTLLKNEKIRVESKVEPELIGGLKVRVNDKVYDGSIKGRLESLKRRLG